MRTLRIVLPAALALVWLAPLTLSLRAAPSTQITAGNSAAITAQTEKPSVVPDTPEGRKIFDDAQTREVRDTLQAAIDSAGAGR